MNSPENTQEEVTLPNIEPIEFDYEQLQRETTNVAMVDIYKIFGELAETLVYNADTKPEEIANTQETFAQKVFEALINNKVPVRDMEYIRDSVFATWATVIGIVNRRKTEVENEIMARTVAVRDPGTNKYSERSYDIGALCEKIMEIRKEQDPEGENNYAFVTVSK